MDENSAVWTLTYSKSNSIIFLKNDKEVFNSPVINIKVPDHEDLQDEHVLIYFEGTSKPVMCSLSNVDSSNDLLGGLSPGDLSNSTDFVSALTKYFNSGTKNKSIEKVFGKPKSQVNKTNHQEEDLICAVDFRITSSDDEVSDEDQNISDLLSSITSKLSSTPQGFHEGNFQDAATCASPSYDNVQICDIPSASSLTPPNTILEKTNKKIYGPSRGAGLYQSHASIGKVVGNELPKFSQTAWPPPFHQAVIVLRDFLKNNCGSPDRWTESVYSYQRAYFNHVFLLHGTATNSGNITLYYKVSQLSERCWKLAESIMGKIETGIIEPNKKKKAKGELRIVYQTHFNCLRGKHPFKDEEHIHSLLSQYDAGNNPPQFAQKKMKDVITPPNPSSIINSDKALSELSEKLDLEREKRINAVCKKKELETELFRQTNDFSRVNRENINLQEQLSGINERLKIKNQELEKEKKDNSFLMNTVKEQEQKILKLEEQLNKIKKENSKLKKRDDSRREERTTKIASDGGSIPQLKRAYNKESNEIDALDTILQTNRNVEPEKKKKKEKKSKELAICEVSSKDGNKSMKDIEEKDDGGKFTSALPDWDFDIQKINLNSWVAVIYGKDEWYIGRVDKKNEDSVTVDFLAKRRQEKETIFYGWPSNKDCQNVSVKFVLAPKVTVTPSSNGRGFTVTKEEFQYLNELSFKYAEQYM